MIRRLLFLIPLLSLVLIAGDETKPKALLNVRDFGAVGDGVTKDTAAFQKALDTCAVSGGGEVFVPAGKYLLGSIQMGNRTILRLEKDSILAGSPDLDDYPIMDIRWEGRWQQGHRSLIYAANVDHTGILGPGRIEGNRAVAFGKGKRGAPVPNPLPLDARGSSLGERAHLFDSRHGRIAGEGGQQCPVGPSELHRFIGIFTGEQPVDEAAGKPVAAADTVENVQLTGRRDMRAAVHPGDRAPAVVVR